MLSIAIHGGAGRFDSARFTAEHAGAVRAALAAALDAGFGLLERGSPALDAVSRAVQMLEDDPLFNAGRGAALDEDGAATLDAAVMEGRALRAGAVAHVRHVRNPVLLARAVMEHSPHVMLVGDGAEEFALRQGLELVPNSWFRTAARQAQLERARAARAVVAGELEAMGTVGAVARDAAGDLAAATSTGGLTNKLRGRVGDSPVIGAGTYASNRSCAVSATGHGEYFIRAAVAHDVCARMEHGGAGLREAVAAVVHGRLRELGAEGGLIAVGREGELVADFNSPGMFRALRSSDGRREVAI